MTTALTPTHTPRCPFVQLLGVISNTLGSRSRPHHCPPSTEEETEAQREEATCPKSHSREVGSPVCLTPLWFLPLLPTSLPTRPLRGKHRWGPLLSGGGGTQARRETSVCSASCSGGQAALPGLHHILSPPPPGSPGAVPSLMCLL